MMKKLTLIAGLLLAGFTTQAQPKQEDYYNFTRIPLPENVVLEAGGIAMLPNGNLAVSTRRGDIYTVSNPLGKADDMRVKLFARGPAGKELHPHVVRLAERIANGVDIAAAGTDSKVAVGQHGNATGFEHDVFRQWDSGEVVVVLLLRLSLSGETGQQQAGDQCKFFHHQISLNSFS